MAGKIYNRYMANNSLKSFCLKFHFKIWWGPFPQPNTQTQLLMNSHSLLRSRYAAVVNRIEIYTLQFGQMHFAIIWNCCKYKYILLNLENFIFHVGQIHFTLWTNTFCNQLKIVTITGVHPWVTDECGCWYQLGFSREELNLENCILHFGQMYFALRKNTFSNCNKYIWKMLQIQGFSHGWLMNAAVGTSLASFEKSSYSDGPETAAE